MTRKVAYTTARTLAADAAAWMQVLEPHLRHPGPGPLVRAALVVLDLQRYFLEPDAPAFLPAAPAVVPAVLGLVRAFCAAGRPVVFTRHADPEGEAGRAMEDWWGRRLHRDDPWAALSPDIAVLAGEPVLVKTTYSAFQGTGLADLLKARGADTVVLCGVQTHLCVETTARHAFALGFRPVVVADATAAPDLDLHLGALRGLGHGLARVVLSADIVAGVMGLVPGHDGPGIVAASMQARDQIPPPPPWGRERLLAYPHSIACSRMDAWTPARGSSLPLDLLVIGAGPAGLAAATQAHRMGLRVLVIERDRPGGLVRAALRVENYPGFPGGIRGEDLAARIEAQARAVGVAIEPGEASALSCEDSTWVARGPDGRSWQSRSVVLASGTRPRRLEVPGEADLGRRILMYRVDKVPRDLQPGAAIVVGGGDCALDQALHLWQRGWRVEVLVRGPRPRALPLLVERAAARGIAIRTATMVLAARERDGRAVLVTRDPEGEREREAGLVLVAVGREPCAPEGVSPLEDVDALGRAPEPGLYFAGDCRRGLVRQTAVAVGDGVAAAMDAARFLESGRWR